MVNAVSIKFTFFSAPLEVLTKVVYTLLIFMDDIKIYKKIELIDPVMIAGWPGMGNVASGVVDYLCKKLKAVKFAQIETDPILSLDSVAVDKGIAKFPRPPQNIFYYSKNPDIIIFEGESQTSGQAGINLLNKVLDVASTFKTKTIYTGAAFPLPASHKEPPVVYGACNKRSLLYILSKYGIRPMDTGRISGSNGLLLGFALERGMDAICLLSTMPQYAISLPNPKASNAIIEMLQKIVGFKVEMGEMDEYIKDMDEKMALIEDKVKDVLIVENEEHVAAPHMDKTPPPYIMNKIEKLFKDAKLDKAKARFLKLELDRWDLYKTYEDRFLDLFKDNLR